MGKINKKVIVVFSTIIIFIILFSLYLKTNSNNNHSNFNGENSPVDVSESVGDIETNSSIDGNNEQKPILRIEDSKGKKGGDVVVKVNIENNPGVLGMKFSIFFDDSVLTIKSVDNGDAIKDVLTMTSSNNLINGSTFLWDGQEIKESEIRDGEIMVLQFSVNNAATVGKYPITIICEKGDAVDENLKPIEFVIIDNYIEVTE